MKYWIAFINFIFNVLCKIGDAFIAIYRFFKMLWMPFYVLEHPYACAIIDWLNGKKTYIVSTAAIIGLIWGYHHHSIDFGNLVSTLPVLVVAMTIRHGMARDAATALSEVPVYPPICPNCLQPVPPIPQEYDPNHHC
jgi:hypothetical protein